MSAQQGICRHSMRELCRWPHQLLQDKMHMYTRANQTPEPQRNPVQCIKTHRRAGRSRVEEHPTARWGSAARHDAAQDLLRRELRHVRGLQRTHRVAAEMPLDSCSHASRVISARHSCLEADAAAELYANIVWSRKLRWKEHPRVSRRQSGSIRCTKLACAHSAAGRQRSWRVMTSTTTRNPLVGHTDFYADKEVPCPSLCLSELTDLQSICAPSPAASNAPGPQGCFTAACVEDMVGVAATQMR